MSEQPVVLDTHAWLWMLYGDQRIRGASASAIVTAAELGKLYISAITPWEVALLESRGRIKLHLPCEEWMLSALEAPGLQLAPLSPAIAVASTRLPGEVHGDPADRIIIATARALKARLVTHDAQIIRYARGGHCDVVEV